MSPTDDPLGIAVVAASAFPANHGTPGHIRELCEALARRGHRVHVITFPMRQPIAVQGVTVHRVAPWLDRRPVVVGPAPERPLLDLLMVPALVRCVRRHRLDLVHAFNYEGGLVGRLARPLLRRPVLYHAVNTMADELPSYGVIRPRALAVALARVLDRVVPAGADHVCAISEELREFLLAHGVRPERVTTIPAGVDTAAFDAGDGRRVREDLGVGDAPLVVYTGTLDRFQRVDYLVQAMAVVAAKVEGARLLLAANVATGEALARVRQQVDALGLGARVDVRHPVPLDRLPDVLAAADVTVCPRPACPGFPIKILNAMAACRPVVTFRGSAKGLVHLESAWIAPDHDWQGLAEGVVVLLRDRALAARLAHGGRAAIEGRFDWPTVIARTEALYRQMLAPAPGAATSVRRAGATADMEERLG